MTELERVQKQANEIRKYDYVILNSRPCKVMSVVKFRTGKLGRPKIIITGIDVFDKTQYKVVMPVYQEIIQFENYKREFELVVIENDNFHYLDENSDIVIIKITQTSLTKKIKEEYEKGKALKIVIVKAPIKIYSDNLDCTSENSLIDTMMIVGYEEFTI